MRKNILIVDLEPLSPRRISIFCIKELLKAGFKVQHLYISPLLGKKYVVPDTVNENYEITISSYEQFTTVLKSYNAEETVAICEFFYNLWEQRKILKILSDSKMFLVKFERYSNADLFSTAESLKDKIIRNFTLKNITDFICNKILLKIYIMQKKIKSIDFFINSGNHAVSDLYVNHPDYDEYLIKRNGEKNITNSIVTFIDTSFGKHPDAIRDGSNQVGDNILWQKKLCKYFGYIEKKYNTKVVIAAHPKSDYDSSDWEGRVVYKGKTLELILYSDFVLQDVSAAISFSIMCKKKVQLITTSEFYTKYHSNLDKLGDYLKLPIVFVDKDNYRDFGIQDYDENIYEEYIYRYLTNPETENKVTSQIIIDWLSNI